MFLNLRTLYIFIAIIFFLIAKDTVLVEYNRDQKLTILLLLLAIYLWTISSIPTGAASVLLLVSMLSLNLVASVEEAFLGFLSPALYFILILTIVSKVLVKVGMDRLVAKQLLKISRSGPQLIMLVLPITMLILPVILPSAFARFKMLLPFVESLNASFGFEEKSRFKKYALYVIGLMNQNATIVVYTGGGFPILAGQLLNDYGVANLSWLEWFILMAPPLWIGLFIVSIFVRILLYKTTPEDVLYNSVDSNRVDLNEEKSDDFFIVSRAKFWLVIITFLAMIITWIVADQEVIPILLPPMMLLVLYSLPRVGLIDNKDIKNFNWENFLLLGSSFSIGILMESNGTAQLIAESTINLIDEDAALIIKISSIALFVFLFRMVFIVPSSAIIVIFPVVISYAEILNIPALNLAFLVALVIGGSNIFPIHAPPSYFAFQTGTLEKKEHYIIATFSTIVLVTMAVLAAYFYW